MKLFDIKLSVDMQGAEELFLKGATAGDDGIVELSDGQTADFEAYFNLLSYGTYIKYCGAARFAVEIVAEGGYLAEIMVRSKSGKLARAAYAECRDTAVLQADLSGAAAGGYAFLRVTARGACRILGGNWSADIPERRRVKVGIIICTYRREEFVCANLERIGAAIAAQPEWGERLHVIVVDNAKTLGERHEDFYDIIPNRNLGGSGGFARGMYEADNDGSYTNYLLMDDDVQFDFSIIKRTWYLLRALSDEHAEASVGGAMLVLEKPCIQHEFGGRFKEGLIFQPVNGNLDMRDPGSLLRNENAAKPGYNAWWYCCMPASVTKKYGLPMPFFIKGDDAEYGMRTMKELILTSGIAVWHQGFEGKYSAKLEYYIKRNGAVLAALRLKHGRIAAAIRFAFFMFKNLTLKNYDCVELIYRAYLDFKAGSKFFLDTDPAELNAQIQSRPQEFVDLEQVKKLCGGILPELPEPLFGKHSLASCFIMLLENYMPSFFFSGKTGITDARVPRARDCFMKKTVVQYDKRIEKGEVFRLDPKRRRRLRRATYRMVLGTLFLYGKIRRDYLKNYPEICSRENWEKLFFKED